ncbi:uncharacterized protein LOC106163037 [Lingula anatina]|uniref:chitin synthase n=1 Tax=Lingula anatina TaxID=7574 RepID=A0A1S3ICR4_LINAN|nr:uncharacterized protein LOC106163037 [Lingula anatina]|eukprot:XP_013395958.1 uncharacterized protein LOC106163037 [Lingula anatina]
MCLFVFKALPEVHTLDIMPLFYATGLVPALLLLTLHIKAYRQSQEKKFRDVLLDTLVVLIHLGCVVFICVRWDWNSQSLRNFVPSSDLTLPISILLISFGWWENFVNTDANNYISTPIKNFKTEMRRHRSLIYSYVMFLKMIATLCFTLGILYWNGFSVEDIKRFFTADQYVHEIERMALISVGCILGFAALLSYISVFLTCTMGIPRFGFVCVMISMVLSALVVFIPLCSEEALAFIERYTPDQALEGVLRRWLVGGLSPNCDPNNPDHLWAQIGLYIGLLLSHLLLNRHVWNSLGKTAIPSLKWIFIQPLYCGILLEQSFMFRRRLPKDVDVVAEDVDPTEDVAQIPFCNDTKKKKPMVYACGTMWHESETEMRQMLASIIRLDSAVEKEDSIFDYETHIMFDDAFTSSTKTEYEQPVSSKKAATDPRIQTHETKDGVKNNPWNQKIVNNYVHNFFRIILEDVLRKDVDHVIVQGVIRRGFEEALRSSNTEHSQLEAKAPATETNVECKQTCKGKGSAKKSSISGTQASSPVNANDKTHNPSTGLHGSSNPQPRSSDVEHNRIQTKPNTSAPVTNGGHEEACEDIDRIWVIRTPYGGRIEIKMENTTLYVHLKDKDKIRHRKRWSQVMYMYYLLLYNTKKSQIKNKDDNIDLDNVYLLALDGDVDFHADALTSLVKEMASDKKLGAACGRIHPIGSGPMVWYQKFEYAIGHWLQKSAEHVLGCVLCSPGCFSLFRGKAVMEVIDIYSNRPTKAIDYLQFDQGEDRWLCTLLLQNGRSIKYCAASDAWTYAPETFSEFYNQRRRWSVSTIANLYDLISNGWQTSTINDNISFGFIVYQALLLVSSLLGPATVLMAISTSITTLLIPSLSNDTAGSFVANGIIILPIIFYIWVSFTQTKNVQLKVATILSGIYALLMIATLVGIIVEVGTNIGSMSSIIFLTLVAVFVTTALLHPKELYCVLYGLFYFIAVPSMYVFLAIYSLSNLNDVSWGTREAPKHVHDNEGDSTARKVTKGSEDEFNCGSFFGCICRRKNDESHNKNITQRESLFLPLQERRVTEGDEECPKSSGPTTAMTVDKQMLSGASNSNMAANPQELSGSKIKKNENNTVIEQQNNEQAPTEIKNENNQCESNKSAVSQNVLQLETPKATGPAATSQNSSTTEEQQNGCDPTNNENKHALQRWTRIRGLLFEDYTWTSAFNKYNWEKEAIKTFNLQEQNNYENTFWMHLIKFRLEPIDKNADEEILKKDLKTLRNNSMIFVLFCNAVWITFTILVQNQTDIFIRWHDHNGYEQKSDILSLLFLSLFILVTIIQFICMLWHRFWTLILYIATAASSLKFGKNRVHPFNNSGDNAGSGTSENRNGDCETDSVDNNVGVENGRAIPPSAGDSETRQVIDEASPSFCNTSDKKDASLLDFPLHAETSHSGATHPTYGTNPIKSLQPKDPNNTASELAANDKSAPQTSQNVSDPVKPLPPLRVVYNMAPIKQQSDVQQTGIKHVNHVNELTEVEENILSSRDLAAKTNPEESNSTMSGLPAHGKRMSPGTNQQSATNVLFVEVEGGGAPSGILKPDDIPQNSVPNNVDYSNQTNQVNAPDNLKDAGTADDTTSIESLSVPGVSVDPNSTVPLLDANNKASKNVKPYHPPSKTLFHNFDYAVEADAAPVNASYDLKDAGSAHPTHDTTLIEPLPQALPVEPNTTASWSDADGEPAPHHPKPRLSSLSTPLQERRVAEGEDEFPSSTGPTSDMHSRVSDTNIQEPTATHQTASEQKSKNKKKKKKNKNITIEQQNCRDPSCDQVPAEIITKTMNFN